MSVIPFPFNAPPAPLPEQPRSERIRGIEHCLNSLAAEAEELGLDLVAHFLDIAREAARDCRTAGRN